MNERMVMILNEWMGGKDKEVSYRYCSQSLRNEAREGGREERKEAIEGGREAREGGREARNEVGIGRGSKVAG